MKAGFSLASLLLFLMVGCAPVAQYVSYSPHPGLVSVPATQPAQPAAVDAYASIIDLRQPDEQLHKPLTVEARLRIDNHGSEMITLDPHSLELTTGDLVRFLPAEVNSPGPIAIVPGQSAVITADFPFPDNRSFEQIDLYSLQLRWSLQIGTHSVEQSIDFQRNPERRAYYYADPYPYPYDYPYVGGVVVIRHRW